jgi:hypothetical protein
MRNAMVVEGKAAEEEMKHLVPSAMPSGKIIISSVRRKDPLGGSL